MSRTWLIIAIVLAGTAGTARAEESTAKPAAGAAAKAAASKGKAEAIAGLNGSWSIELTPMYAGEKAKPPMKDTLSFDQGKVSSAQLGGDGYLTTNATITIGDDGVAVWETMQTSEGKGVAFWRGELHSEKMSGVLSKHPVQGNTEDYSFSGTKTGNAPAPVPVVATPVVPAAPAVVAPAVPASPAAANEPSMEPSQSTSAPVGPSPGQPAVKAEPAVPAQPAAKAEPAKPVDPEKKKKKWF